MLAVAVVGAVLSILLGGLAVSSAVLAGNRAATAADLAALAAASVLTTGETSSDTGPGAGPSGARASGVPLDGGAACREADRIARANRARVTPCTVTGADVDLTVTSSPGWRGLPDGTARARAGPPRSPP